MTLYKGVALEAGPLQIQVTAPSTGVIHVVGFSAYGTNSVGGTSRPILHRPSLPGQGTGYVISMSPPPYPQRPESGVTPLATLVTTFFTSPSVPLVNVGSYNLPFRVKWDAPLSGAQIIGAGGSILLYALTNGRHKWDGEVLWEEK